MSPAELGEEGIHGCNGLLSVILYVDGYGHLEPLLEELPKTRHGDPPVAEGKDLPVPGPAVPGVQPPHHLPGVITDGPAAAGGPLQRWIVADDGHPVGGEMHIQLQPIDPELDGVPEGCQGILRAQAATATVSEDLRSVHATSFGVPHPSR